ncbi:hypothetical protein C2S53_004259 [Perilla frutescens var. hirtella]|uniref:F-box/LRR-repeat protein 15/At3g58940/PEG3-like LRR domain-containing protein n=1 Tax=Perilla frutescens var. hirtella TaxID=608512 RepID=A0AAD4INM5_PERFH|nr:hypothetical protein C2S53_004259 [Perilla frutescens var. hirtella]
MEKKRREFSLPPEIIGHIQSFMNGKEAARTTVLSKSLYNAWSKRPNLDFDDRDFGHHSFSEFTKKTMQRYEDLNLKIVCFKLRIKYRYCDASLAKELIVRAIKLGAFDLNIEIYNPYSRPFVLPDEVFGSETLDRLCVNGCTIDLGRNVEVTCSKLKSLHLSQVVVINGDLFRNLILKCPSIEKLVCDGHLLSFEKEMYNNHKLNGMLEYAFHKLKSLTLDTLKNRETLFFQELLLKFPCLKFLAIQNICNCGEIRICSQSLEYISFVEYYKAVTAEFDVPNIRKFRFEGSASSCFTFETTCGDDWGSDIRIMCYQGSALWFSSLRKLLQNLSMSKVSLSIHVKYPSKYICDYTGYGPIAVVENLRIMDHALNSGLLDGLFLICHPKFVNQHYFAPGNNDLLELLCTKLVDKTSENHCIPNPSVRGLEEVTVEVFERSLAEWQPLPLKTLLDASVNLENTMNFRFRLRWRPETSA